MAVVPYTACGAPEGRGCEERLYSLLTRIVRTSAHQQLSKPNKRQVAIVPKLDPRARAGGYQYLLLSAVRMSHRKPCHWQNCSLDSICQASPCVLLRRFLGQA